MVSVVMVSANKEPENLQAALTVLAPVPRRVAVVANVGLHVRTNDDVANTIAPMLAQLQEHANKGGDTTHSDTSKYHYQYLPEYKFRPGSYRNKRNISGPNLKNSR